MSYTYEQRKRPQEPQKTATERTAAPGPGHNALIPETAIPQDSPSFDLAGAMQARMTNTFGDLSAVRNYTPPEKTQVPAPSGPYTGPVTHAISDASPSPSAAGPMQAKKFSETTKSSNAPVRMNETVNSDEAGYNELGADKYVEFTETPGWWSRLLGGKEKKYKRRIKRSAYDLDEEEINQNRQNPENLRSLDLLHQLMTLKGDEKKYKTPEQQRGNRNRGAWEAFKFFTDNEETSTLTEKGKKWSMDEVNDETFIPKLRNMARMANDYPVLGEQIGALKRTREKGVDMSAKHSYLYKSGPDDNSHRFVLSTNPDMDKVGEAAAKEREHYNRVVALRHASAADMEFSGNHELGHMLNYDLVKRINANKWKSTQSNEEDMTYHITADKLVRQALKKSMSEEEYDNLVTYDRDSTEDDKDESGNRIYFKRGQINLKASGLGGNAKKQGHTSAYGATNAAEFFAEAFADVYAHGKNARQASIELVKAYEKEFAKYKNALPY